MLPVFEAKLRIRLLVWFERPWRFVVARLDDLKYSLVPRRPLAYRAVVTAAV